MKPRADCHILSFGDLVVDLNTTVETFPIVPEGHQLVSNINVEPGGAGNFLIAGSHLGARMKALGVVGDDLYGNELISIFQSEGIDSDDIVVQKDGSTTLVFVLADGHGQHVFLGHVGAGPAVGLTSDWRAAIQRADAVHTYGYTLQEARLAEACLAGMAYARELNKPVFFDPGPYAKNVDWALREEALARCSAVLLTVAEIPLVLPSGKKVQDAAKLLSDEITLVVVKLGQQGCIAFTHAGTLEHPGFPVSAVDTAGAGDSFAAALIISLMQGYPLADVLAIANAMGAAKAAKLGSGRQMPTLSEVQAILGEDLRLV